MKRSRVAFVSAVLLMLFGPGVQASWGVHVSMLELVEQSDVIFTGKVTEVVLARKGTAVEQGTATIEVGEILFGTLAPTSAAGQPVCVGVPAYGIMDFRVGEHLLFFGERTDGGQLVKAGGGQGVVRIRPEGPDVAVQAAKRLLPIALLGEKGKDDAMLALAGDQNDKLRREVCQRFTVPGPRQKEKHDRYTARLASLVQSSDPKVQTGALMALRFAGAYDQVPRMIELAHSQNFEVVDAACKALAWNNTKESAATRIELTKHQNPKIRMLASRYLRSSKHPGTREALAALLSDPEAEVRAAVHGDLTYWRHFHREDRNIPGKAVAMSDLAALLGDPDGGVRAAALKSMTYWRKWSKANDDVPRKVVAMLNDEDARVGAAAAGLLGRGSNPAAVPPLLAVLRSGPGDEKRRAAVLGGLRWHYERGDVGARKRIDREIELVIAALKSGGPDDAAGVSLAATWILIDCPLAAARDALQWAVRSHLNERVRNLAKRAFPEGWWFF